LPSTNQLHLQMVLQFYFNGEIFSTNPCKQVAFQKNKNSVEYIVKIQEETKNFKILVHAYTHKSTKQEEKEELYHENEPEEINHTETQKFQTNELKCYKLYQNGELLNSAFISTKKTMETSNMVFEPTKTKDFQQFFEIYEIKIFEDDVDSNEIFKLTFHLFSEIYFQMKKEIKPKADSWDIFMKQWDSLSFKLPNVRFKLKGYFDVRFEKDMLFLKGMNDQIQGFKFQNFDVVSLYKNSLKIKSKKIEFGKEFEFVLLFNSVSYKLIAKLFQYIQMFDDFKFIDLTCPKISLNLDLLQNRNFMWFHCQKEIIIQGEFYTESNTIIEKGTRFKIQFELELPNDDYKVKISNGKKYFEQNIKNGKNEIDLEEKGVDLNHPMKLKFAYKEVLIFTHKIHFIRNKIKNSQGMEDLEEMTSQLYFEGEMILETPCKQVAVKKTENSIDYVVNFPLLLGKFNFQVHHTDEKRREYAKKQSMKQDEDIENQNDQIMKPRFYKLFRNQELLKSSFFLPNIMLEIPDICYDPRKTNQNIEKLFEIFEIRFYFDNEVDLPFFILTFHAILSSYFKRDKISPQTEIWNVLEEKFNSYQSKIPVIDLTSNCLEIFCQMNNLIIKNKFQKKQFHDFQIFNTVVLDNTSVKFKSMTIYLEFELKTQHCEQLEKLFQFICLFNDFEFINLTKPQTSVKLDLLQNRNSLWIVCQKEIIIQRKNYLEYYTDIELGNSFKIQFELDLPKEFYILKVFSGKKFLLKKFIKNGKNEIDLETEGMDLNLPMELKYCYKSNPTEIQFYTHKIHFRGDGVINNLEQLPKIVVKTEFMEDFGETSNNPQDLPKVVKTEVMEEFEEIPISKSPVQPIIQDSHKESTRFDIDHQYPLKSEKTFKQPIVRDSLDKNIQSPPKFVVKTEFMEDFEVLDSKDIPRVRDSIKVSGNSQLPPKVVKTEIMKDFEEIQTSNNSPVQPISNSPVQPIIQDSIKKSSDVISWSVEDVCKWVRRIGSVYVDMKLESIFKENLIDGEALMSITNGDLKEMGFNLWGHRFKIMNEINKLK
jgi:hypothetical protein